MMTREEYKRQFVHILMGFWSFYPLFLAKNQALCIPPIITVLVVFFWRPSGLWPQGFEAMARKEDYRYGILVGPLIYIVAIELCVFLFPTYISAVCIGIMALGDGFSTIIGENFGRHHHWIDRNKTYEGSTAFFVAVFLYTLFVLSFISPVSDFSYIFKIALAGSISGTLIEILPFENRRDNQRLFSRIIMDDNFFVPLVSGIFMYVWGFVIIS
ncbi:MAG: SEC59/DGK1/VTE5 family protein [Euryarchaeota archaeon]|nr:SEC59/DGK1/VTE5 family protein [Euryarchaeota archaeon]